MKMRDLKMQIDDTVVLNGDKNNAHRNYFSLHRINQIGIGAFFLVDSYEINQVGAYSGNGIFKGLSVDLKKHKVFLATDPHPDSRETLGHSGLIVENTLNIPRINIKKIGCDAVTQSLILPTYKRYREFMEHDINPTPLSADELRQRYEIYHALAKYSQSGSLQIDTHDGSIDLQQLAN